MDTSESKNYGSLMQEVKQWNNFNFQIIILLTLF